MSGGFLILLIAMFGFLYLLLIRPQRQQQRKHSEMLGNLKPGDEIITAGGIYGEVVQLDAERVMIEIDEDVKLQTDAIVSIKTKGLIGEKFVQVSPGGSDKVVPAGGQLREVEAPVDLEELISKYVFGKV